MPDELSRLIDLLEEKEGAMEELVAALAAEESALVRMDLAALEACGRRKEEAAGIVAVLRDRCGELIRRLSGAQGEEEVESLSRLIASSSGAEQALLLPIQERLLRGARTLEGQFRSNRRMIENSLRMVRNSIGMMGKLLGGCETYGSRGTLCAGGARGALLRREM